MNKVRPLWLGFLIIVLAAAIFPLLAGAATTVETRPASWVSLLLAGLHLVGLGLLAYEVRLRLMGKSLFPRGVQERVVWGGLDILAAAGFFFFTILVLNLFTALGVGPQEQTGADRSTVLLMGLLPPLLTSLYVVHLVRLRGKDKLGSLGLKRDGVGKSFLQGLLCYVTSYPLLWVSIYLVSYALLASGYLPQQQEMVQLFIKAPSFWFLLIPVFHTIIVGPFVEEMLFRGFLQGYLSQHITARASIVLTSLLFAVIHGNLYASCQIFFLSLILGYIYHRTRSLAAPVALHGLHNALQMLVLFTSPR